MSKGKKFFAPTTGARPLLNLEPLGTLSEKHTFFRIYVYKICKYQAAFFNNNGRSSE
jgi:hypothetical protein